MNVELVKISNNDVTTSCYFRTAVKSPFKKVYLELNNGDNYISFRKMIKYVMPNFKKSNVARVTLVGDKILEHPNIIEIVKFLSENGINVCINSDSIDINEYLVSLSKELGNVHFNFNLNNFLNVYDINFLSEKIEMLGRLGLINGISICINENNTLEEYYELFSYFKKIGIKYVYLCSDDLLNKLEASDLLTIKNRFKDLDDNNFEIFYARFPQADRIGKCHLGRFLNIAVDGSIGLCPHIIEACKSPNSKYKAEEFTIGNIFKESCDINSKLISYALPIHNTSKQKCENILCTKGCYAVKIAQGLDLFECDKQICELSKLQSKK